MPFKSDEQRKAAFARMKGRTGGRGPRGPRPPRPPRKPTDAGGIDIFQIIEDWITREEENGFNFLENGPGIPGSTGGPVTLTGGAVYNTPGSQWWLGDNTAPLTNTNAYDVQGNNLPPPIFALPPDFIPAETFWGYVYLYVQGIDPISGQTQWGGAGTLRDPLSLVLAHELNDTHPGTYNFAFHEGTAPTHASDRTNEQRPWWAR